MTKPKTCSGVASSMAEQLPLSTDADRLTAIRSA